LYGGRAEFSQRRGPGAITGVPVLRAFERRGGEGTQDGASGQQGKEFHGRAPQNKKFAWTADGKSTRIN